MSSDRDIFLKKFEEKLKTRLDKDSLNKLSGGFDNDFSSNDYEQFRVESLPKGMSFYEKTCNLAEKLINIKPDKKTEEKVAKTLFNAHLGCTPAGVISTSIFFALLIVIIGLSFFVVGSSTIGFGLVIVGIAVYFVLQSIPSLMEKRLRAKANDEIIIAVFYIVAFMRFNSNLELAVNFAANYLNPPLSMDFKRMLWDIDNARYPNIKIALDKYLEGWRDDNLEFLEAIYLIESSLFESEDFRRISLLDKALDTILQGSYERMLHFAQELRGKVATFNMIGVVLPILGLIILPLAASFGSPKSTWEVVFILYNILFPIGVTYFGFLIIFNRPAGISSIKVPKIKGVSDMQKVPFTFGKKTYLLSAKVPALIVFSVFLLIGLSPVIFHMTGFDNNLNLALNSIFGDSPFGTFQEYKNINPDQGLSYTYGPYGTYSGLLSLFIPLSFAFGFGYYLRNRYKQLIHLRDKTKKLEIEFSSSTFQLGSRINEGISAELAFGAVAETMKGTETGAFFSHIDTNIKFNGMSVEKAIFDPDKGAINVYPSELVNSSMKIFIKANEKGPEIASKTLVDLSKYLSEIHMSGERIKDLLAESLGSMKGQAKFLAPLISGVVISIVSLVTMIMGSLSKATESLAASSGSAGASVGNFLGESIPTYLFQSVVGLYITMLIALLIYMVSNLENGEDPIYTKYEIGDNLIKGMTKYAIIVAIGVIGFTFVGFRVLGTIV